MDKTIEMKYQNDYWETVLEEQLAEKDKEIEELKAYKKGAYEKYVAKCAYLQQQLKEARKQVCDEIKEYIAKEYGQSVEDMPKSYHFLSWSVKEMYELLDKIVEGEI